MYEPKKRKIERQRQTDRLAGNKRLRQGDGYQDRGIYIFEGKNAQKKFKRKNYRYFRSPQ